MERKMRIVADKEERGYERIARADVKQVLGKKQSEKV
jgi:hypothetical protein